ncbi:MAG: YdcF family protein, partial [Planctomycetes bacterium]|nr:YdcF family protein [Planctomycetota bacterium]
MLRRLLETLVLPPCSALLLLLLGTVLVRKWRRL